MQPRLLLTPSLYDSWRWFNILEEKPKQEFLNTLLKVREPPNDSMLAGLKFEDDVRDFCEGRLSLEDLERSTEPAYVECVKEIADEVRGGIWQQSVKKDVVILGNPYLLYGKTDVMRRDWVKDIKFTKSYEVGKYTPSVQHPIYLTCSGMPKFRYLITDGRSVWKEDYFAEPGMEESLRGNLATMISYIMADPDFNKAFTENWKTLYDNEPAKSPAAA